MTDNDIQQLIDRYLGGSTSVEEERQLARELLREDIPADWQAVRLMQGELAMGEAEYDDIMARRQTQKPPVIRMSPRWMAAAACLLLLIGIGAMVWMNKDGETPSEPLVAKMETPAAKVEMPTTEGAETKVEKASAEEPSAATVEAAKEQHTAENLLRTAQAAKPVAEKTTAGAYRMAKAETTEGYDANPIEDHHLQYASHELTKDTLPYQDPSRVDEFIAKLADYNKVKQGLLTCSAPVDSNMVSAVYVFPDKKDIDVFGRLLQVACWYKSETPGYRLSFTNQQFFFELKDMRRQLQYRWIAERINGKILLYGTHAPIGAKVSSACFQEYRDELMYQNSIIIKTKKL